MKKMISLVLVFVLLFSMVLSLTGCGGDSGSSSQTVEGDITFPLEEEVTITFMVRGTEDTSFKTKIAENKLWKRLKEASNVNVDFIFLGTEPEQKLTLLINSGNYGDVLVGGPVLNAISASRYFASGIFQDLTNYVNEDYMPNLMKLINDDPEIKAMISSEDGKIYTLPQINGLEGSALESPLWINKAWLDKLGLKVPKTLDEFTKALQAFKTEDPNGNGVQDEIPYLVSTTNEFYSLEALYGCWGLAFKNGELDGFCGIKDGKVYFGPTQEAYKEAVAYQAMLYQEGLMWNEVFTASASTASTKLSSDKCVVGCFTSNAIPKTTYSDDYVCLVPPTVKGYEACWYVNPSLTASKDRFYVTDKCKNVGVVAKFMDYFYEFENAFELQYGAEEDGRWYMDEDGNRVLKDNLSAEENNKIDTETPTVLDMVERFTNAITTEDYKTVKSEKFVSYKTAWDTYGKAGVLNDEIWPRPYYSNEDANKVYRMTTDIFYHVNTYRARWITGEGDINEEWDEYINKLEDLDVDEMVTIMQRAYDSYLGILDSAK